MTAKTDFQPGSAELLRYWICMKRAALAALVRSLDDETALIGMTRTAESGTVFRTDSGRRTLLVRLQSAVVRCDPQPIQTTGFPETARESIAWDGTTDAADSVTIPNGAEVVTRPAEPVAESMFVGCVVLKRPVSAEFSVLSCAEMQRRAAVESHRWCFPHPVPVNRPFPSVRATRRFDRREG